ncbi:MAG: MazG family protein [Verrucomicrobia bacterium]|nr:MazG family protein [Verrucomicrobiota bacterium]MBU6446074.1 MazG family protein [Verrucomicrobiota bacterium]MDE3047605.1 MazG family protein [Verrucomicrobiota bacterium]
MTEFERLLHVADRLLGPNGCPWDLEQTFFTLQPYLLEETHELLEAIDQENRAKIMEELGDVLYALIFIAKLGEKEGSFSIAHSMQTVADKLIRRHPHIFGDKQISSTEEVLSNWEEVKKKEGKKSPIADIPPALPALARAQKVLSKMKRKKGEILQEKISDDLGQKLWDLVREAEAAGIDAEGALRRTCIAYEQKLQ